MVLSTLAAVHGVKVRYFWLTTKNPHPVSKKVHNANQVSESNFFHAPTLA